jgi:two-component system sensor histidine kinase CpxA
MALEHMEQDLDSLDELIGRLLTLARLDATTIRPPATKVDLSELVAKIVRDAEFESQKRNIALHLSSSGGTHVQGDHELLRSAVENVVRNAVQYTGIGTCVEVSLAIGPSSIGQEAWLVIRDHGPGVGASELQDIFRPFYRTAKSRDRRSGGAGLGLAIAERIVRLHHGTILAKNVEPHGLQITITFPVA